MTAAAAARPSLAAELDQTTLQERRRALRALLRRPLLAADGPRAAELALVRRHARWLRDWLARHPGWRLEVSSELARLRKVPAELGDGSRPAREPKDGVPFSRRRYVILCLALAALERCDRQTTLGDLAGDVMQLAAADPALAAAGVDVDLETRDRRRDLVQVVRLLLDLRLLVRLHGDEQQYLEGRGDALYDIRRPVLAAMLNVRRGPSTIAATDFEQRLRALVEEPLPDSAEGKNRRLRSRLTRQLLDDPVLYYDELSDDELAYLQSQRGTLVRRIGEDAGLIGEIRREGIAMVDERVDLTDLGMPEEGTDGHLALLLAEHLAEHARRSGEPVGLAALEQHTAALIAEHRHHWARRVTEPGAAARLLERTVERLEALRLVRRSEAGVAALPAIGRFALAPPRRSGEAA